MPRLRTRLPTDYKVTYKQNLSKYVGSSCTRGMCGPELKNEGHQVPAKHIFVEANLDEGERRRVLVHELVHALWYESGFNFEYDDRIELEALLHMEHSLLTQAERTLVRYLTNDDKLKKHLPSHLRKIRERIDKFLGL